MGSNKEIPIQDRLSLIEQYGPIVRQHIMDNILNYCEPDYIDKIKHEITQLIKVQIEHLYNFDIEDCINSIVSTILHVIYESDIPKRSHLTTFTGAFDLNINNMTSQIDYLRKKPQPEQRTEAWYSMRHDMITASDTHKIFGTPAAINQIIWDKCQPIKKDKFSSVNTDSPFHWGQKYEPVSVLIYEFLYNTTIEDFGCIQDDDYTFIGASPDGINVDPKSERYGRMLEIKNPVSRPITGIPIKAYWIQMQQQMSVCKLPECDFLETSFKEYETYEEFNADGTFKKTADGKYKGIILYFLQDGKPIYEYAPVQCSESDFKKWETTQMQKHKNDTWNKTIYWKLDNISCILVTRNEAWFNTATLKIKEIWETIEHERKTGCDHRAAKKRPRTSVNVVKQSDDPDNLLQNVCLIDTSKME